jgi:hypothetical protein
VSVNADATRAEKVIAIADATLVAARPARIPLTLRSALPRSILSRSMSSASGRETWTEIEIVTAIETAIARANENGPTSQSKAAAIALNLPSVGSAKD